MYANPAAIELIKTHSVELDWEYVCLTPTVKSMRLLEKNPDKIYWPWLSLNPAAMHLLEKNTI